MFRFLPILLLVLNWTAYGWADQVLLPHERFRMMGPEEREEFIKETMELMVELESKYEKYVAENGPDEKMHQTYTRLMQGLLPLFISEAHASTPPDWKFYSEAFQSSLANSHGKSCFYAGWISRTNKDSLCLHPKYLTSGTKERKDYEKANSGCRNPNGSSKDQIACNPAVFGFKNPGNKSLFCVPSGRPASYNSAYACMQLALGIKTEAGAASRQERLKDLEKQFKENPDLLKSVYSFVSKVCVCEPKDFKSNVDESYMSRIRPHRTCLGMMKMISDASLSCELPTDHGLNLALFRQLNDFNLSKGSEILNVKEVDSKTANLLNNHYEAFRKSISASDKERICKGIEPEPTPPVDGDSSWLCQDVKCTPGKEGEELSCEGKVVHKDADPSTAKVVNFSGLLQAEVQVTIEEGISTKCKVVNSGDDSDKKAACSFKTEETEEGIAFSPEVSDLAPDEELVGFTWSPEGPADPMASSHVVKKPEGKETIAFSVKAQIKKGEETIELDCGTRAWPEKDDGDDGKGPTLTIKKSEEGKTHFSATGEVSEEGWEIIWFTKGKKGTKPNEDKKPAGKLKLAGDSEEDGDKQKDKKKDEPISSDSEVGKGKSVKVERDDQDYQLCAKATKEGKKAISANPQCLTVPKKEEQKIQAPVMQQNQGQPQMFRQGANTSATGIR